MLRSDLKLSNNLAKASEALQIFLNFLVIPTLEEKQGIVSILEKKAFSKSVLAS